MANWSGEAVARLAAAVRARRTYLGLTQGEVTAAGGPTNSTLTSIENGRSARIVQKTLKKLDSSLQWPEGTALAYLTDTKTNLDRAQTRTPLENVPTETLAEIASEALSELRRRIIHPRNNGEGRPWGGLDPGGHWPQDDEQP